MSEPLRPARIDWSQGQPFSPDFGDVYFSRDGGPAETAHVFLDGNRLRERLPALAADQPFTLLETGFGTGLNWLCTQALWAESGRAGWLHVVSIEKHPLLLPDLARAQSCWPGLAPFAALLQQRYPEPVPGFHRLSFPSLRSTLTLVFADVADALSRIDAQVNAFFLDGFAPSRNPDMWQPGLYGQLARLGRPGASVATFTAAGEVRRGLQAAGFVMEKTAGFGKKREMLRGILGAVPTRADPAPWLGRPRLPATHAARREAVVIGAGVAGATTARALADRGWQVTVLERGQVAGAASGNPAAVLGLTPAPPGTALDHFPQQAGVHMLRELHAATEQDAWHPCGVLELPAGNRRRHPSTADSLPASLWQTVAPEEASRLAGVTIPQPGAWQALSGWLAAGPYCRSQLAHAGIRVHEGTAVVALDTGAGSWLARGAAGEVLARAPVMVVATGQAAGALLHDAALPLRAVRGQVSLAEGGAATATLRCVVCEQGYLTPVLPDGHHCLGASFVPDDSATDLRAGDHAENLARLRDALPELAADLGPLTQWRGRAAVRCQSPDYLPLVGPLADTAAFDASYGVLRDGRTGPYPALPVLPGLYVNVAHGSHGFTQALLAAEILAAELNGEPAPVGRRVLDALHPMRFRARALRRHRHAGPAE